MARSTTGRIRKGTEPLTIRPLPNENLKSLSELFTQLLRKQRKWITERAMAVKVLRASVNPAIREASNHQGYGAVLQHAAPPARRCAHKPGRWIATDSPRVA